MSRLPLLLFTFALPLGGCDTPSTMPEPSPTTFGELNTELGALPKLISLPREPLEARWSIFERSQGQASTLYALLRYEPQVAAEVVELCPVYDRRDNERIDAKLYDQWVPPEAKKGVTSVERGSRYELIGIEPRRAEPFAKAKLSPYVNGNVTPLPDGYVLVVMEAR